MAGSGAQVAIEVDTPREQVFRTIVDPTSYPAWLVGGRVVRSVDRDWPTEGSAFRHVIGFVPLLLPGSTTSQRVEPGRRLQLRAGMGPLGAAVVTFELFDTVDGGTRIVLSERFVAGAARCAARLAGPVVPALVWGRNAASLEALRDELDRQLATESG